MDDRNESVEYGWNDQFTHPSAIDSRIDTTSILKKIDMFLSGSRQTWEKGQDGSWVQVIEEVIQPPLNPTGRFFLMGKITSLLHKGNVQGNFEGNHYDHFMADLHRSIANSVIVNRVEWGISENHMKFIVDFIVQSCEPFFSRLKDDKERSHFDMTVRTVETNRTNDNKGLWNLGRH